MAVQNIVVQVITRARTIGNILIDIYGTRSLGKEMSKTSYPAFRIVILDTKIGCNDQLITGVDPVFQPEVNPVIGITAASHCRIRNVTDIIRLAGYILCVSYFVRVVIGMVVKITACSSYFFTPEITIVDSKGIGLVDAILLSYQEVTAVAKIACVTTAWASATIASTLWPAPATAVATTAPSLGVAGNT
jgi:hypothetical protein